MKRILLPILLLALLTGAMRGQSSSQKPRSQQRRTITVQRPDLEQVKRESLDPKSKFYFPKLWKKYERNDTVMTPEEFRYLYLGYMFQEDYDPYRSSPYESITDPINAKKSHTAQEIDTLIKYAELSLYNNPFDLRNMSFLVRALKEKQKTYRAKFYEFKLENLLAAIKSTGTGADAENAWYVIYPAHEYDLIQIMGLYATDVDFDSNPGYDILQVNNSQTNQPAGRYYFNVGIPTEQFELKHPEDLEPAEE